MMGPALMQRLRAQRAWRCAARSESLGGSSVQRDRLQRGGRAAPSDGLMAARYACKQTRRPRAQLPHSRVLQSRPLARAAEDGLGAVLRAGEQDGSGAPAERGDERRPSQTARSEGLYGQGEAQREVKTTSA